MSKIQRNSYWIQKMVYIPLESSFSSFRVPGDHQNSLKYSWAFSSSQNLLVRGYNNPSFKKISSSDSIRFEIRSYIFMEFYLDPEPETRDSDFRWLVGISLQQWYFQ